MSKRIVVALIVVALVIVWLAFSVTIVSEQFGINDRKCGFQQC